MGSLDVDSLFANIFPDKTVDIYTNTIYSQQDVIEGINKEEFQNILSLARKESYFIFNEVLYKQKNVVAMGSPPDPTLANVCLCLYEKNAFLNLNQFFMEDLLISMYRYMHR